MLKTNNWQLAVVDWDMVTSKSDKIRDFVNQRLLNSKKFLKSGTVVYIVDTYIEHPDNDELKLFADLLSSNKIFIAKIWVPKFSEYGFNLLNALHPICTEKDVVEMETKFGITFDE